MMRRRKLRRCRVVDNHIAALVVQRVDGAQQHLEIDKVSCFLCLLAARLDSVAQQCSG